jgi:hypothetical protein
VSIPCCGVTVTCEIVHVCPGEHVCTSYVRCWPNKDEVASSRSAWFHTRIIGILLENFTPNLTVEHSRHLRTASVVVLIRRAGEILGSRGDKLTCCLIASSCGKASCRDTLFVLEAPSCCQSTPSIAMTVGNCEKRHTGPCVRYPTELAE